MVMWPRSMPTASCSTLATGARQLVVQDALLTTVCSGRSWSWLTPNTTVRSAPSAGADTSTFLAPAPRWPDAFSLLVKMPVHSSTMSTPSRPQGSRARSRSARTLIGASSCRPAVRIVQRVALEPGLAREPAVHAVVAEQMRVGRRRVVSRGW